MLLAYVDESGKTGDPARGASQTFTLGCVLLNADAWPQAFNRLIDFRRRVKVRFAIPMSAEVKASYLISGRGDLGGLVPAPAERRLIYRAHLHQLPTLPAEAFAIVLAKDRHTDSAGHFKLSHSAVMTLVWDTLLQRLSNASEQYDTPVGIFHDEGEDGTIRRLVRRSRRYLTAGSLHGVGQVDIPLTRLVDDPTPRRSHQSYFTQLADLVAYAAFRSVKPPGRRIAEVCPEAMWDEIGVATRKEVNSRRPRAAPGIVLR